MAIYTCSDGNCTVHLQVAQLVEDVQRLQASLNKLRESTAAQVAKLEEELAAKNKAFRVLEERLQSQENYEEIKRELGVLKSIEFAGAYEEDEEKGKSRSLEVLLLEKNKALQSENTQLKVASADFTGPASAASAEPSSSASPEANSSNGDGATNAFAQIVGEELVQNYRPESSSQSTTPATSTVRSPPETPTSLTNHFLPPTPTSSSAAAAAAAAASVSAGVIDARHFPMPPPSPFYGYPGLATPFHPAFMPVNMVKSEMNSSGGLDTTYVAKNVRELLAVHNIGQRLFAKHVLGLSQGTVSELLSKPKSWDKLTEKGRESYRKMHAWATDDSNILALKAISPKKGSQSLVANTTKDDTVTEDRIASILSEAQQAMQAKKVAEQQQVASAVVSSIYQMEMSRMVAANPHLAGIPHPQLSPALPSHSPLSHIQNHHHPHQNSSRKKQRELERDPEMQHSRSRNESGSDAGGENSQDMVTRIYRQELEKLKKQADTAGNVAASAMYQQELERLNQQKHFKQMQEMAFAERERQQQQLNGLSIKAEPPDSTSDDTASQTMCGPIDLSSKPSAFYLVRPRMNGHDSGGESPQTPTPETPLGAGAALPESLSPLQRMQNIANSLTSRPHMGMPSNKPLRSVLPPITQEQFDRFANINTEDLVKKVKETLSQYSISQRLFGESVLGLSQGSVSDLLARPKPWHMLTQKGREPFIRMQIFLSDTEAIPKLVSTQYRIPHEKLMRNNSRPEGGLQPQPPSAAQRQWGYFAFPSAMLEVLAMTSEIETLSLTARVKDVLQFHNLGQKLFGEAVLGLSQGSVSELLSKPKPWHMLSIKGREPFIKMHLWLSDAQNVEQLKYYQSQIKAHRRRKGSSDERGFDSPTQPKRPRVFFTEEQKEALRAAYNQDPYPNQSTIESLASELGVGVKTVINWFHNHRMRAKQQHHSGATSDGSSDQGNTAVKSEPGDENSNHSDISNMSGDTMCRDAVTAATAAALRQTETNQWMFPQFEPVALLQRKLSEEGGTDWDTKEGRSSPDDRLDEPDGSVGGGKAGSEPSASTSTSGESAGGPVPPAPVPTSGVNKRKRSNPQRVYEGTQLDRTHTASKVPSSVEEGSSEAVPASTADDTQEPSTSSPKMPAANSPSEEKRDSGEDTAGKAEESSDIRTEREERVKKLQQGLRASPSGWEEGDDSQGSEHNSIEKLQRHTETSSNDGDWEF
ncbi:hypothetical protein BaRGS_00002778 [Batillaria attramentaria]|uniref:Homeobox protein cut-like n=1 Tax=Batillaria attramentaria TaxID=370345 RepID=A0ABD0M408_9CAEN